MPKMKVVHEKEILDLEEDLTFSYTLGLSTVKYIYGPATAASSTDAVIGSSISGRIEAGITIARLITITMPMKGVLYLLMFFQM